MGSCVQRGKVGGGKAQYPAEGLTGRGRREGVSWGLMSRGENLR